jgi:hypothetical protein
MDFQNVFFEFNVATIILGAVLALGLTRRQSIALVTLHLARRNNIFNMKAVAHDDASADHKKAA